MFLPFFLELKAARIPVSLREYLSLLEGLEAGLVDARRAGRQRAIAANIPTAPTTAARSRFPPHRARSG